MAGAGFQLEPQVLKWARERAALAPVELAKKVKVSEDRVATWEQNGHISPSQLQR